MHKINLVNNPFDNDSPAWQDDYGRLGVRVPGENTVFWYDALTEHGSFSILDEVTMYIDEPFNDRNSKCLYSIT